MSRRGLLIGDSQGGGENLILSLSNVSVTSRNNSTYAFGSTTSDFEQGKTYHIHFKGTFIVNSADDDELGVKFRLRGHSLFRWAEMVICSWPVKAGAEIYVDTDFIITQNASTSSSLFELSSSYDASHKGNVTANIDSIEVYEYDETVEKPQLAYEIDFKNLGRFINEGEFKFRNNNSIDGNVYSFVASDWDFSLYSLTWNAGTTFPGNIRFVTAYETRVGSYVQFSPRIYWTEGSGHSSDVYPISEIYSGNYLSRTVNVIASRGDNTVVNWDYSNASNIDFEIRHAHLIVQKV